MKFSLSGFVVFALLGQSIADLPYNLPDYRRDNDKIERNVPKKPNVDHTRWVPIPTGTGTGCLAPKPTTLIKNHVPHPPPVTGYSTASGSGHMPTFTHEHDHAGFPTWTSPKPTKSRR